MAVETGKTADTSYDGVAALIEDLTRIVEEEVAAFQSLLDVLTAQQQSILKGDTRSVSLSSEQAESIMEETRRLAEQRRDASQDLSSQLDLGPGVKLSELIPVVESRYARRLQELREMLDTLAGKIQYTNRRNQYLLEHSLHFVDQCMRLLARGQAGSIAYGRSGRMAVPETSLYSGVG